MATQPNQLSLQKLKFRITSCTSEEQDYPASELLTQSPQSKGWQSARFCDYPQEITLQFMSPVRLKQVQFLSHQSKIASKIEIYVYIPDPNVPYDGSDIKFKKLGYLSLDSNERTGYQARELKSVYIDAICLYLKLIIHKHHVNKFNLFNQVGLIAISSFGEILSQSNQLQMQGQQPKEYYNEIQYQTQFDEATLQKLRALEQAKDVAVKEEDFEECKRLKDAIDRLKQIGIQLRQLDERKAIAIQNEDYESAQVIKAEIDRLRNAVAPDYLLERNQQRQKQQKMQDMYSDLPGYQQQQQGGYEKYSQPQSIPSQPSQGGMGKKRVIIDEDEKRDSQFPQQQDESIQQPPQFDAADFSLQKRGVQQDINIPHDEVVIPALTKNKKTNEDSQLGPQDDQNQSIQKAESLTQENRKLAEPLIPILGEENCEKIFSKIWTVREEGLKLLEAEYRNPKNVKSDDPVALFTAMMGAVHHTIGDKIVQVAGASMTLLQSLCRLGKVNQSQAKGDLMGYIDGTIATLLEKIGDANVRVREQAENSLMVCGQSQTIGNANVVIATAKGAGLKVKFLNSFKHIAARNFVLDQFVKKFQINNKDVPFQQVVEFAVKSMSHANDEVRKRAMELLVDIYIVVGEQKLRPQLVGIPPQQLDALDQKFEELNGGGGEKPAKKKPSEKEPVIQTNINVQGANKPNPNTSIDKGGNKKKTAVGGGGGANQNDSLDQSKDNTEKKKAGKASKEDDTAKVCEFCGKFNKDFTNSNNLDIHLWKECPMLTNCQHCAQVVEISTLGNHLLSECEQRRVFKKCPRCKEPIHNNDYQKHTEEMGCTPAKAISVSNRCCLCHTDIPPGPSGWKKHLTVDGCPNNERSIQ